MLYEVSGKLHALNNTDAMFVSGGVYNGCQMPGSMHSNNNNMYRVLMGQTWCGAKFPWQSLRFSWMNINECNELVYDFVND